jgi:hypothetical protein
LRSFAACAAAARSPSERPASLGSVGVGEHPVREARGEGRLFLVERGQCGLVRVRELRSRAHEREALALDEVLRLGIEAEAVPLLVDRLHPRVELRVEVDRVGVRGELRRDLGLDLLDRRIRVRLVHVEEDLGHPRQQLARPLHRDDRVLERRRLGIRGDRVDLGALPLHALLEGGQVVGVLDAVERRGLVEERALRGEGIRRGELGGGGRGGENGADEERSRSEEGTEALHRGSLHGFPVSA